MSDFQFMPTTIDSTIPQQQQGFHVGEKDDILHPEYFNQDGVLELVPVIFSREPMPYEYVASTTAYTAIASLTIIIIVSPSMRFD